MTNENSAGLRVAVLLVTAGLLFALFPLLRPFSPTASEPEGPGRSCSRPGCCSSRPA